MKTAILEDNLDECNYFISIFSDIMSEYINEKIEFDIFQNIKDFKENFHINKYDIVFIDCYLKNNELGFDAGVFIRSLNDYTPIIFTTSSPDFAIDSYDINASGYLIKPISKEKLKRNLDRLNIIPHFRNIILDDGKEYKFNPENIIYCESSGHYTNIISNIFSEKIRISCLKLLKQLDGMHNFYNCYRGYIVNFDFVDEIQNYYFIMRNGSEIPISKRNFSKTKEIYYKYMFDKMRR